ncbi:TPA: DUF3265 domain-containing protein [Vibrio vulnificus]|uniref:DUF3265 domain-containing protein n=1 Tax=Vibrio ouci TaxID=2499078 RepID=A0A4Y8W894_9VIBR|nr:DUF3265 domain-containing protein [Vibrio ouci]HAS6235736.1 DUF3265 domain-containing protein [Vibrio vulnificus]TFH88881.1 DUF3265 domain-containing protein [Vibrio ouci]TFH89034.1 DUF3265 domain-containing protein [Vibrio ouci]HAS8241632.1 DUF3265 domain-containing protein [Vibrio vulnificus]
MIRNAWRFHFGLSLVFTAQCLSSVFALLTR